MKHTILISFLGIFLFSSCLKKNTEVVEGFSDNNINDVAGVWFRYIVDGGTSREVLKKVELNGIVKAVDKTTKKVTIKVTPSRTLLNSIPEKVRVELKLSNIAVVVALPTGAKIEPVGNAPKLGINGDWTQPNLYRVKAANGSEAEWTIHVTELNL